jgi:hypothetical protein
MIGNTRLDKHLSNPCLDEDWNMLMIVAANWGRSPPKKVIFYIHAMIVEKQ